MTAHEAALEAADELIKLLKTHNLNYTNYRELLAKELFHAGLLNGNYEVTTDLHDPILPDLKLIQEDEYDQHMNDRPPYDEIIGYVASIPSYVWLLKR